MTDKYTNLDIITGDGDLLLCAVVSDWFLKVYSSRDENKCFNISVRCT